MDDTTLTSLLQPKAYPEPTSSVQLIQTHVSWIFLTDEYVYKVKKPVNYGFLDFSSLDKRRFFCDEEVRLNSRLCPDIYLQTVPLVMTPDGASFHGEGEIIDYAVLMKRLPAQRMLDVLVDRGAVTPEDMRSIADVVGRFHLEADRSKEISSFGTIAAITANCNENFSQLTAYIDRSISHDDLSIITDWTDKFLKRLKQAFERRVLDGFIRDCDGDLHLENICLADRPYIFDCIEFNNRFRYSDTAADVAFLLMDLDFHGREDLGDAFLEHYRDITSDEGLDEILPFYKIYRAMVRGKVESFRLDDPGIPDIDKEKARRTALRYFSLAKRYSTLTPAAPRLILTCGLMGSGKSFVSSLLAPPLKAEVIASDRVRKELAGIPADTKAHEEYNSGIYSPAFTNAVYLELLHRAETVLKTGRTAIVDASFRKRGDRELFRHLAASRGSSCLIIETFCPETTTRERLQERSRKKSTVSDGRWELFPRQKMDFEPVTADEQPFVTVDTTREPETIIAQLIEFLGAPHVADIKVDNHQKASA